MILEYDFPRSSLYSASVNGLSDGATAEQSGYKRTNSPSLLNVLIFWTACFSTSGAAASELQMTRVFSLYASVGTLQAAEGSGGFIH